jgi:hypothetical protein
MAKIYSNKLNISVSLPNIQFTTPVAKAILTVSSDGINYSTSASGHKLYFKVNTYDANDQPTDTYIRGIYNIIGAMTGKWELDFIVYGQAPFQTFTQDTNWNADIVALTKNGTLVFSVEWYEACISQECSTNLFNNPTATMNLSYDTLPFSKQNQTLYTNNINYELAPETICTPKNIDIIFPVELQYDPSSNLYILNLQSNQTYNLILKITDNNSNICPNCSFIIYYNFIPYRLYSNANGIIYYSWEVPPNLHDFGNSSALPFINDDLTLETACGNTLQASLNDFNFTINGIPAYKVFMVSSP